MMQAVAALFRLFTLVVQLFTLAVQASFQFEHPDGVAAKALELNVLVWSAVWWWCGQSRVWSTSNAAHSPGMHSTTWPAPEGVVRVHAWAGACHLKARAYFSLSSACMHACIKLLRSRVGPNRSVDRRGDGPGIA